jgi:hypothetical protein
MRISKYKVYDADAETFSAGESFVASKLEGVTYANASKQTDVRWAGIPVKDIISVSKEAAVAGDAAHERDVTFATDPSAGDEFALTIQYPDSRQRVRKSFRYVAKSNDDITAIAVAFKDLINASDIPFGASNAVGVLTITADVAGAGYDPTIDAGTDSASTTVTVEAIGAATLDAERTDAGYFAAKHEGVDADDFGDAAADYVAFYITYSELVPSAHGKVVEERVAAMFFDADNFAATESGGILEADLNAASYIASKEDLLA